jgi:hypothetical protein
VHFLQIWILPERGGIAPSYEQKTFADAEKRDRLRLVASPDAAEGSVTLHANARIFATLLGAGAKVEHTVAAGRHAWIQVVKGAIRVGDALLHAGDGASTSDAGVLALVGVESAEALVFDLA